MGTAFALPLLDLVVDPFAVESFDGASAALDFLVAVFFGAPLEDTFLVVPPFVVVGSVPGAAFAVDFAFCLTRTASGMSSSEEDCSEREERGEDDGLASAASGISSPQADSVSMCGGGMVGSDGPDEPNGRAIVRRLSSGPKAAA